jgi:transposase-like protein
MKKETIRYSEGFKRQLVKEFEEGKFSSMDQARKAYQIKGCRTVPRWIAQYGNPSIQPRILRIETMKEKNEIQEARKRIRELEAALSDAHIDHTLGEAYLEIACERMGEDAEAFKKKNVITLSGLRRKNFGKGKA